MLIVGIAGNARSGKDTVAYWLEQHRGAIRYAFASPIKQAINAMGLTESIHWTDPELKEKPLETVGVSPRVLAQTLGTEWGRDTLDPDFWIKVAEHRLKKARVWYLPNIIIAISDVRFPNEAEFVRRHGFVIHMRRNGADGNVGIPGHASEQQLEVVDRDVVIENNGTIDDLHGKLGALFPRRPDAA
jgi:hypothetical protein